MDPIKTIILQTPEEKLETIISPFIREQFPNFMKEDYGKLVLFIKAYYEWLEKEGNAGYVMSKLDTIWDIDQNSDQFFSHFRNTYLSSFPEVLGVNEDGDSPNKTTLLKKIRDFYGNKGTESAYKFLFRILYDSDLDLYYPKKDILKISDGQWTEPKSLKTTSVNGNSLFGAKGGNVYQYRGTELLGSAFVDDVIQYNFTGKQITEFFLTDIVGDFTPNFNVQIVKDDNQWEESIYSVLGEFFVELPGSGYRVGDFVGILSVQGGTFGEGFSAKVEQTGLAGGVKKISIVNSGINYSADVVLNVFSDSGNQSAKVIGVRSAITSYPGYFSNNKGKISSDKKIHDGHYYQDFSYELKSRVSIQTYFDVLKKLIHPSGMRMFGTVLVKDTIQNVTVYSSQYTDKTSSIVGRYTPYALRTFNNLRNSIFLPNQVRGTTLQVWLSTYSVSGNTATGVSAGWTALGYTALGVNVWNSLVGGFTFGHYPAYEDVWTTPRFKEESVNTHPSLVFRPVNDSTSDLYSLSTASRWRSFGYGHLGPTMGRLGLTASRSYFVVCKPRRLDTAGSIGSPSGNTRHILSDSSGQHGIAVGYTGGNTIPRVFGWNTGASRTNWVIGDLGPIGEWKLISQTFLNGSGNSGPLSLFLNGICLGTTSSAQLPTSAIQTSRLGIGMPSNTVDTCFDGEIAEILCYQGDVGEADRQKIEGYLAHKYDLAGKLPSSHPYKNIVPGGSFAGGTWYGSTGDYYPRGYNPYIGTTSQVGPNGTTASPGSLFLRSSLGYTYNIADEFGITAHNPIGMPLGSTASWYRDNENNMTPDYLSGLVLWLKPENIGVCGSAVAGASMNVWLDASAERNHAVPPTWDRFTYQSIYQGVTIDKLRPTLSIANGITGISFGGGKIFSPWVSVDGTGKTLGGLGISFAPGGSGESLLTARHFYLTRGITLNNECDIFIVFKPTAPSANQSLVSSNVRPRDMSFGAAWAENVFNCRDWNASDRLSSVQNSTVYYSIDGGVKRYYSIVGPFSFIPYHGTPTLSIPDSEKRFISYDPHVCGLCFDRVVGEAGRDRDNILFAYYNGDRAINRSPSTGLSILSAYGESETSMPPYIHPISFGRFGAFVWGNQSVTATGNVGSAAWLSSILSYEADYSFSGVINEVIVYNKKLTEVERQIVYSYLSRKYSDLEKSLPKSYRTARAGGIPFGVTYWHIENHPNSRGLNTIARGSEFSGMNLRNFFSIPTVVYKSEATPLADGTTLGSDTYSTV